MKIYDNTKKMKVRRTKKSVQKVKDNENREE